MWAVGITHTYNAAQLRQSGADAIIGGLETLTPQWIDTHFAWDALRPVAGAHGPAAGCLKQEPPSHGS